MRYGLISDVHGNPRALRACIAALRRLGVDAWVCAGDLVGYGPAPNECVDVVTDLGALIVAGNHELVAIGQLPLATSNALARDSHVWTRAVLRADVLAQLERLPRRLTHGPLVVAHGSLDDPEEYVSTDAQCAGQLDQLSSEHPDARFLVLGHTHKQRLYVEREGTLSRWTGKPAQELSGRLRHLINPGSVGQSRQWEWPPRARAAVLDVEKGQAIAVRVAYDHRSALRELHRRGLSYRSMHSPPPLLYTLARRPRHLMAAVRSPK